MSASSSSLPHPNETLEQFVIRITQEARGNQEDIDQILEFLKQHCHINDIRLLSSVRRSDIERILIPLTLFPGVKGIIDSRILPLAKVDPQQRQVVDERGSEAKTERVVSMDLHEKSALYQGLAVWEQLCQQLRSFLPSPGGSQPQGYYHILVPASPTSSVMHTIPASDMSTTPTDKQASSTLRHRPKHCTK